MPERLIALGHYRRKTKTEMQEGARGSGVGAGNRFININQYQVSPILIITVSKKRMSFMSTW